MLGRVLGLTLAASVGVVLLYLSRFWIVELWPRAGLFGVAALRPQGGLLGQWLSGSKFAPFELLLWACGVFLVLSLLQHLARRLTSGGKH